ncbi:MAG: hypothetical protein Tsb009_17980 [Planctomycetaceae bacterium]
MTWKIGLRSMHTVVFKIGGSLFDLPELSERIGSLIALRPNCRPVLVAGGGPCVDVVREWDRVHALNDEQAHELAISAMSLGEHLLETLLPNAIRVNVPEDVGIAWNVGRVPIVSVSRLLFGSLKDVPPLLPASWDVTSDSIAAWIAVQLKADEFVLVKSCELDVANPAVDSYFSIVAKPIPRLGWVNLRSDPDSVQAWELL